MKSFALPLLLSLGTLALASPCSPHGVTITPQQILHVAPNTTTCADAPANAVGECATAIQAAPALSTAFTKYALTSKAEQAAVLGLIAFESGEFMYNRNHYPGVPGQGTRNMQSPAFNAEYASSIPAIKEQAKAVKDDPDAVLDLLVAVPEYDFGSGAWFLTTQCEEPIRTALQSGSEEGWKGFIVECVGTEANDARRGYWVSAKEALGV
ncbi:hypothetical protein BJX68DRAFT_269507 [Aspergillus pseudodeflectus]|uniref:Transglycosylase SLT domain-containing protein n=2 Tax=Aspergillus subgen. Nidulantes TaxID=2720870 RepID=A0A0U5FX39_ASPCI|nr:hypothetical protein ASPCAL01211 [Aspergillus calidoustus]